MSRFKFEKMWISNPSFFDLVRDTWSLEIKGSPQFILYLKLKILRKKLRDWNKEAFGLINVKIINVKIKEAEDLVQSLQSVMDSNPSAITSEVPINTRSELHNLLQAEEISIGSKNLVFNGCLKETRTLNSSTFRQRLEVAPTSLTV